MMYLLKVMIFHGELLNNQMVIDVYITRKYPSSSHIPQDREKSPIQSDRCEIFSPTQKSIKIGEFRKAKKHYWFNYGLEIWINYGLW